MTTATEPKSASAPAGGARRPKVDVEPQILLDMLDKMMLIRRFEERTMQAYQQAKIGGFCHIYIGQEACAVGSISALNPTDPIVTAYRDHGHALARGMAPKYAMAEMYGKVTGCAKGKGGSMHFFDKPHHMYGGHAIVGGQCPLGVGLAFAIQYEEKDGVALCYLGDGALNQGAFHEAMNLASIYNLPIIFVLENNMYSMGTHIARGTSMAMDLASKAESYGMRYAECDGLDAIDVYQTFRDEIAKTRNAKNPQWERGKIPTYSREGRTPGPCFCVVHTYRYQGHSMSDPQKYRTKEEVSERKERDPINGLVNYLIEHDLITQEKLDEMDARATEIARESIEYAESSPDLGKDELYTDVYANPFPPYTNPGPSIFLRETSGE